jgi:glycosyltransferase involved in cell wall biosynthesis
MRTVTARKWTINGDFVAIEPTGVARYAHEVTQALDTLLSAQHPLAHDLELDLVVPRQPVALQLRSIATRVVPEFGKPRLPQFWVQLQLPKYVPGGLLSFCNLAPLRLTRHIACIHDLLPWVAPESYSLPFRAAHKFVLPILGRRARLITTVSQLSRQQLVRRRIAGEDKIVVTYNGADHASRWAPERSSLQLGPRPFVLCLSRKQKHKNVALAWRIASALDAMGMDIYLAGQLDASVLTGFGPVPHNLRLLGRVTDNDLAKALAAARCFLLPSHIEGFGLPAVEAMVRGCPVLASTAPALPEVCGDGALYAEPDDASAWVAGIAKLSTDQQLRDRTIAAGHARANAYSWQRIAETYLQLMLRVDQEQSLPNAALGQF